MSKNLNHVVTLYFRHAVTREVFTFKADAASLYVNAAYEAAMKHFGDGNFSSFMRS